MAGTIVGNHRLNPYLLMERWLHYPCENQQLLSLNMFKPNTVVSLQQEPIVDINWWLTSNPHGFDGLDCLDSRVMASFDIAQLQKIHENSISLTKQWVITSDF